jgi:hypothetical protein
MSYTVWMDGTKIGDTALELSPGEGRRAGIFHPTAPGLAVLPGIAAMGPALLDVGRMCRENGIDTEDPDLDIDSATEGIFETAEGRRVVEAAKLIARLELRGPGGEVVPWESLLISDMTQIASLAGSSSVRKRGPGSGDRDPVRYFISAKVDVSRCAGGREPRKQLTS